MLLFGRINILKFLFGLHHVDMLLFGRININMISMFKSKKSMKVQRLAYANQYLHVHCVLRSEFVVLQDELFHV
jgi:hypothetical protein